MSNIVLPPGAALLVFVTFPMPDFLSAAATALVSLLMDMRLFRVGGFGVTLFAFLFALALFAFATQCHEIYTLTHRRFGGAKPKGLPIDIKADIWRAERNFWMSTCIVMVYWCLFRYRSVQKKYLRLKAEVAALEVRAKAE